MVHLYLGTYAQYNKLRSLYVYDELVQDLHSDEPAVSPENHTTPIETVSFFNAYNEDPTKELVFFDAEMDPPIGCDPFNLDEFIIVPTVINCVFESPKSLVNKAEHCPRLHCATSNQGNDVIDTHSCFMAHDHRERRIIGSSKPCDDSERRILGSALLPTEELLLLLNEREKKHTSLSDASTIEPLNVDTTFPLNPGTYAQYNLHMRDEPEPSLQSPMTTMTMAMTPTTDADIDTVPKTEGVLTTAGSPADPRAHAAKPPTKSSISDDDDDTPITDAVIDRVPTSERVSPTEGVIATEGDSGATAAAKQLPAPDQESIADPRAQAAKYPEGVLATERFLATEGATPTGDPSPEGDSGATAAAKQLPAPDRESIADPRAHAAKHPRKEDPGMPTFMQAMIGDHSKNTSSKTIKPPSYFILLWDGKVSSVERESHSTQYTVLVPTSDRYGCRYSNLPHYQCRRFCKARSLHTTL
jgi:hypothetical protein